jgi:hypothetical protein
MPAPRQDLKKKTRDANDGNAWQREKDSDMDSQGNGKREARQAKKKKLVPSIKKKN